MYVTPDGRVVFDEYKGEKKQIAGSKREYGRLLLLVDKQARGEIADLRYQRPYRFVINGVDCGKYVCDFRYLEDGRLIVEDVKGVKTAIYKRNKQMMLAIYKVHIRET